MDTNEFEKFNKPDKLQPGNYSLFIIASGFGDETIPFIIDNDGNMVVSSSLIDVLKQAAYCESINSGGWDVTVTPSK
jgi:hypothetical protein